VSNVSPNHDSSFYFPDQQRYFPKRIANNSTLVEGEKSSILNT